MNDLVWIQTAFFVALVAVLGLIPPIPFMFGVPITAQTLGVMLAGLLLGPRLGAMAMLLFMALVLLGLPLLSGGRGGLGVLAGPTVGFFLAWPFAAALTGWVAQRLSRLPITMASSIAATLGGIVVVYAFGIAGLHWVAQMPLLQASLVVWVFVPGDLVKVGLASLLTAAVFRALPHQVRSRQQPVKTHPEQG